MTTSAPSPKAPRGDRRPLAGAPALQGRDPHPLSQQRLSRRRRRRHADRGAHALRQEASPISRLPEAAMLAGLIKAPSQLTPLKNLDGAQARAAVVLDAMVDTGAIDKAAAEAAKPHPADAEARRDRRRPGHGSATGSSRRRPTITGSFTGADARAHHARSATAGARRGRRQERARRSGQDAPAPRRPRWSRCGRTAPWSPWSAGATTRQSQFNRAIQARRQPGSAFKLFVYLAALRHGLYAERRRRRHAARRRRLAAAELRRPLPRSRHARRRLRALAEHRLRRGSPMTVGIDQVIAAAHDLGIATPLGDNPSIALGTSEVTLLDLTAAYAAVSAGTMPVRAVGHHRLRRREQARAFPRRRACRAEALARAVPRAADRPSPAASSARHRTGGAARRLRGGQDRHQPEPSRRLVHRLQRSARRRRLGRQRRRHADGRGHRRLAAGPDLEGFSHQGRHRCRGERRARGGAARRLSIRRKPARSAPMRPATSPQRRRKSTGGRCNPFACAAKYRSFRLSDCTYQPYDGGPRRVCEKDLDAGGASSLSVAKGYRDDPTPSGRLADVDGPTPARQTMEKMPSFMSAEQSRAEITCGRVHMRVSWTNNGRSWRCAR